LHLHIEGENTKYTILLKVYSNIINDDNIINIIIINEKLTNTLDIGS